MAKLPAKLTISKVQPSRDDTYMSISITDVASGIKFTNVSVSLQQFIEALTGLSEVSCVHETRNTEYIGKHYVSEQRTIIVPNLGYDKKVYETWLINNAQEEGWILDPYLRSQSSVTYKDDSAILNYIVFKYIDQIDSKE